jgi:hypothetical protein
MLAISETTFRIQMVGQKVNVTAHSLLTAIDEMRP